MVEPLISDQLNDDKRMFYVDNVALKVPDLCPRIKKTSRYLLFEWRRSRIRVGAGERETIDLRQICYTRLPVDPQPPAPPHKDR